MNQMLDTTSMNMIPEFTLPSDWVDQCSELMIMNDEEFSVASTEVSMIYEQFQMEEDEPAAQLEEDPSLMMDVEVEPLLCSNLLLLDDDEIFHDPCLPPSGGLDYLESISMDDRFSLSLLEEAPGNEELSSADDDDDSAPSTSQPQRSHEDKTAATICTPANRNNNDPLFEERYKVMLDRLAESMRRSQETRKSLSIHTAKTKDYDRRKSLSGVLSSVEKSTSAIQALLHTRLS